MPHEDFELAIEQRLHGALDPVHAAALGEHLRACADCRDYEVNTRADEKVMETLFATHPNALDLDALQQRVTPLVAKAERARYVMVAVGIFLFGFQWAVMQWFRNGSVGGRRSFITALVCAAGGSLAVYTLWRSHSDQARTDAELLQRSGALALLRDVNARTIRRMRAMSVLMPLISALMAGLAWVMDDREVRFVATCAAPIVLAVTAWQVLVTWPRLRLERYELR